MDERQRDAVSADPASDLDNDVASVARLEAVTVSYGRRHALHGVDADFLPGAVGLLGPNGAGKSTLLKALLGFVRPDRGRMQVLGMDVVDQPLEIRARLGYMPESEAHIPGVDAVAFVAYCGRLAGLPAADAMQRAHAVLQYVGLGEARYRAVDTYSTGMKQRIKLAQALVHDPDLLFLDEPTNGMDPRGREEMLACSVRDLAGRKGVNLILSSHVLPDVEATCERVVVLHRGRVVAQGPIAEMKGTSRRVFRDAREGRRGAVPRRTPRSGCRVPRYGRRRHARVDRRGLRRAGPVCARGAARRAGASPAPERTDPGGRFRTGGRRVLMPIHDHGYARYPGTRRPPGRAWAVIAGAGIRNMLSARPFLFVLLFAWLQFFVRAVMFYLAANVPQADVIAPFTGDLPGVLRPTGFLRLRRGGLRRRRAHRQRPAGQCAADLPVEAADARVEYVAGKLAVVMVFLALVTWAPALLLLVLQTMFTGSLSFVREHAFLIPAITLFGFLHVLLASISVLALSSLSTSARYAGMLYAGAVIFTEAVFQTLRGVTGGTGLSWVSFSASLAQVGDVIFRVEPRYDTPWGVSLAAVAAVIAVSAWVLARRVRGVEIVT